MCRNRPGPLCNINWWSVSVCLSISNCIANISNMNEACCFYVLLNLVIIRFHKCTWVLILLRWTCVVHSISHSDFSLLFLFHCLFFVCDVRFVNFKFYLIHFFVSIFSVFILILLPRPCMQDIS